MGVEDTLSDRELKHEAVSFEVSSLLCLVCDNELSRNLISFCDGIGFLILLSNSLETVHLVVIGWLRELPRAIDHLKYFWLRTRSISETGNLPCFPTVWINSTIGAECEDLTRVNEACILINLVVESLKRHWEVFDHFIVCMTDESIEAKWEQEYRHK